MDNCRYRSLVPLLLQVAGLASFVTPVRSLAMTVSVTDLGLPTSTKSIASYINSEGDVAGIEYYATGSHAFFYSGILGTVTDIGTMGGDTGSAVICHFGGEVIRVRRRFMVFAPSGG